MANVKVIDAAAWAALPEISLLEGEDLATKGLSSDNYRCIRSDVASAVVVQWAGLGVEWANETGSPSVYTVDLTATGVEWGNEVGAPVVIATAIPSGVEWANEVGAASVFTTDLTATGVEWSSEVGAATVTATLTASGVEWGTETGAPTVTETGGGSASGNFTFSLISEEAQTNPTTSPSHTDFTTLVDGDLLIMVVTERSGLGHANHEVTDNNSSTWTKRGGYDNLIGDSNGRYSLSVWSYEATGSETDTTPTISADANSASPGTAGTAYKYLRYRPSAAYGAQFVGITLNGSGTGDWNGTASGSLSTSGDDILEIAIASARNGSSLPTTGNISFSTGQSDLETEDIGANNNTSFYTCIRSPSVAEGSKSATLSSDGSGNEGIVAIMAFRDQA